MMRKPLKRFLRAIHLNIVVMVFDFTAYGPKRTLLSNTNGAIKSAEVDWDRFANECLGADFFDAIKDAGNACVPIQSPPKRQTVDGQGYLTWEQTGAVSSVQESKARQEQPLSRGTSRHVGLFLAHRRTQLICALRCYLCWQASVHFTASLWVRLLRAMRTKAARAFFDVGVEIAHFSLATNRNACPKAASNVGSSARS